MRRLREAGAIVLGKTNVPELTLWPFTETPTFGITRNPWNLEHTPGGSSGGSGAAVAAGLVGAALGSDGLGSIRIPSSFCGLFGIKPQRHRISLAPHTEKLYGWHGLAVYGPIARSVRDAALFLDLTAQTPPAQGSFGEAAARGGRVPGRLCGSRYSTKPILPQPVDARVLRAHEQAVELLRSLGHELVERDPDYPPWLGPHLIARYLRGAYESATDIGHVERMERRSRHIVRAGELVGEAGIARALASEATLNARVGRVLADCDALLLPCTARPALRIGEFEGRGMVATMFGGTRLIPFLGTWNATGQPAVSIPAGFTDDADRLPLAVQLVGRPDDEATLLSLAGARSRPSARGRSTARPGSRERAVSVAPGRSATRGGRSALGAALRSRPSAGALLLSASQRREGSRSKSTPTDLVSEADLASERAIRELLAARRPHDGFVGEEGDHVEGTSGLSWVVDPLDGTVNFLFGSRSGA